MYISTYAIDTADREGKEVSVFFQIFQMFDFWYLLWPSAFSSNLSSNWALGSEDTYSNIRKFEFCFLLQGNIYFEDA